MRYILTLCVAVLMCGCGRYVPKENIVTVAQANADINAALDYVLEEAVAIQQGSDVKPEVVQGIIFASFAAKKHAQNMSSALEITKEDLPVARVGKNDWKVDPVKANDETAKNHSQDSSNIANYAVGGALLLGTLPILLKVGSTLLSTTPVGQALGLVSTIFGYAHPKRDVVFDKILVSIDAYKKQDPDWKNNKMLSFISDSLTQAEKDYIKTKRHDLI